MDKEETVQRIQQALKISRTLARDIIQSIMQSRDAKVDNDSS